MTLRPSVIEERRDEAITEDGAAPRPLDCFVALRAPRNDGEGVVTGRGS